MGDKKAQGFTKSTFLLCIEFLTLCSFVCRIVLQCNFALTNWIKRTFLGSLTPSWSSTEAMRMARKFFLLI